MFGILDHLHPGISPHLKVPARIADSLIPSHDRYKKVCPLANDSGVTMQTKFEEQQSYPNCLFGNKYKSKYPRINPLLRTGLSIYKLNNQLQPININENILNDEAVLDDPHKWMSHIANYSVYFTSPQSAWGQYQLIRGSPNPVLKCKLFGDLYNNPLDLFELIEEEIKRRSVSSVPSEQDSANASSSSSSSSPLSPLRVDDEEHKEDEEALEQEFEDEEGSLEESHADTSSNGVPKTSGGKCMDLLKVLYKFIYTVALQAWSMVHNRFLSRKTHNQSQFEYIFYLIPKSDVKDCSFIINSDLSSEPDYKVGLACIKRFEDVMVNKVNPTDEEITKYILSVSASEFVACTLKFIISKLVERKIVTTQTEVKQRNYAISITNVCMLNSVTVTGMQSVPISDEFIRMYNYALTQKQGSPENTIYVDQQFNKHFQFKMKVYGLKRLKHKNEIAFPIFVSGVFFTPDRPLNKVCSASIMEDKQRMMTNVTRSYFTYGAYFTPNSQVICSDLPDDETFPAYLIRRCSYWYSFDKNSCLMYLSKYNPDDDPDSTMSDLDLCAVSELEWSNCMKELNFSPAFMQLKETLFDASIVMYDIRFWPLELSALYALLCTKTDWLENPGKFYMLYLALTKLIHDDYLLSEMNVPLSMKDDDRIIMFILFHSYPWKSLSECIQTLRMGRVKLRQCLNIQDQGLNSASLLDASDTWSPYKVDAEMYEDVLASLSISMMDSNAQGPLQIDDIHNLVNTSMMYMKGDLNYTNQTFVRKFESNRLVSIRFQDAQIIHPYIQFYKLENIELCPKDESRCTVLIKCTDGNLTELLDFVSLFIIYNNISHKSFTFFASRPKASYRMLDTESTYLNVAEVRSCLSYQLITEQRKVLNLDVIQQAYFILSEQPLDNIQYNPSEYIMLRHIRDIVKFSGRPEFSNPIYLQVLEKIIGKLSRKRKVEHITDGVNNAEEDDDDDVTFYESVVLSRKSPKVKKEEGVDQPCPQ